MEVLNHYIVHLKLILHCMLNTQNLFIYFKDFISLREREISSESLHTSGGMEGMEGEGAEGEAYFPLSREPEAGLHPRTL